MTTALPADAIARLYGGIVFDVDGVLARDDGALPGARETLRALDSAGIAWRLVTNNSTRTPAGVATWLAGMGLDAAPEQISTSAEAVAALISPGTVCLVIGSAGLHTAIQERGCPTTDDPDAADAVVVGQDRELTLDALRRATLALGRGVPFLAANDDPSFPAAGGAVPGAGAIVAALETASGRRATVAGKPHAPLLRRAATDLDGPILMVGDRPETDLIGADALGWDTALVLTGITAPSDVDAVRPRPRWVLEDVSGLLAPSSTATPRLLIRQGRRTDLTAIESLWEAAGMLTYTDAEGEVAHALVAAPDLLVVAELDGKVVGVGLGAVDHRRAWLFRLAVAPAARRQGVATGIVQELEDRIRARGVSRISLLAFPDNTDAHAFWTARGYGTPIDVALFVKRLAEPACKR